MKNNRQEHLTRKLYEGVRWAQLLSQEGNSPIDPFVFLRTLDGAVLAGLTWREKLTVWGAVAVRASRDDFYTQELARALGSWIHVVELGVLVEEERARVEEDYDNH